LRNFSILRHFGLLNDPVGFGAEIRRVVAYSLRESSVAMRLGAYGGFLAALTLSGTYAFVTKPGLHSVRLPRVPQKTRASLAPRVNTARRTSSWNNWGNQYRNGENLARAYGVAGVSSVGFWIASAAAALA
jgi:hypothetical protein